MSPAATTLVQQFNNHLLFTPTSGAASSFGAFGASGSTFAATLNGLNCTGTISLLSGVTKLDFSCTLTGSSCSFSYACTNGPCYTGSDVSAFSPDAPAPSFAGSFVVSDSSCGASLPSSVMIWQQDHSLHFSGPPVGNAHAGFLSATGIIDNTGVFSFFSSCMGQFVSSRPTNLLCFPSSTTNCTAVLTCQGGACNNATGNLPVMSGTWAASGSCAYYGAFQVLQFPYGSLFVQSAGNPPQFAFVSNSSVVTLYWTTTLYPGFPVLNRVCVGSVGGSAADLTCTNWNEPACQLHLRCVDGPCLSSSSIPPLTVLQQLPGTYIRNSQANTCPTQPTLNASLASSYLNLYPSFGYGASLGYVDAFGSFITYAPYCYGSFVPGSGLSGACTTGNALSYNFMVTDPTWTCVLSYCPSGACPAPSPPPTNRTTPTTNAAPSVARVGSALAAAATAVGGIAAVLLF